MALSVAVEARFAFQVLGTCGSKTPLKMAILEADCIRQVYTPAYTRVYIASTSLSTPHIQGCIPPCIPAFPPWLQPDREPLSLSSSHTRSAR
jgi:hypothetical protein